MLVVVAIVVVNIVVEEAKVEDTADVDSSTEIKELLSAGVIVNNLLDSIGSIFSAPAALHSFDAQKYVFRPSNSPTVPGDPQPDVQHRRTTLSMHRKAQRVSHSRLSLIMMLTAIVSITVDDA